MVTLRSFASRSLGSIIERAMALAPSLQNRLAAHAGKVVSVRFGPVHLNCEILASGVLAPGASQTAADLTLALHPISPARIMGDTELAALFSAFPGSAQEELEEWLSRAVGDILARRIVWGLRSLTQEFALGRRQALAAAGDYLSGEMDLLPMKTEVDEFMHEVHRLQHDVDALAARIEKLGASAP